MIAIDFLDNNTFFISFQKTTKFSKRVSIHGEDWKISSISFPEYKPYAKTFFLRGLDTEHNLNKMSIQSKHEKIRLLELINEINYQSW